MYHLASKRAFFKFPVKSAPFHARVCCNRLKWGLEIGCLGGQRSRMNLLIETLFCPRLTTPKYASEDKETKEIMKNKIDKSEASAKRG